MDRSAPRGARRRWSGGAGGLLASLSQGLPAPLLTIRQRGADVPVRLSAEIRRRTHFACVFRGFVTPRSVRRLILRSAALARFLAIAGARILRHLQDLSARPCLTRPTKPRRKPRKDALPCGDIKIISVPFGQGAIELQAGPRGSPFTIYIFHGPRPLDRWMLHYTDDLEWRSRDVQPEDYYAI